MQTFDDLGDKFVKAVFASGKEIHQIDVTFDRYKETSIECARLQGSVLEVMHPFEELLKMAQYRSQSPGPTLWLSMKTRQIYHVSYQINFLQEPQWIRSSLLVADSNRKMQSSVSARKLISEHLKVFMKRQTLELFHTVYTQMQNSLSACVKTRTFSSF